MYCERWNHESDYPDSELERTMVGSSVKGEGGYYLALNPDILQSIIGQMAEQLRKFNGLAQSPVVLTSQVMRVHFYRLVEQVLSGMCGYFLFNEIANNVQIQSIGGLRLEAPVGRRV
ncbi:MAG: FHIPEP family type III secretion protein [Enterocloster clostridioformis]